MLQLPVIGLVPLDPIDPGLVRQLAPAIADFLPLPVRILPAKPLPLHVYHATRNQYHSTGLLEYLLAGDDQDESESFRVLGITAADLYIPIFTFVFGEAQLDGKAAVISIFRPGGGAGDGVPPRRLLQARLVKLSLHELGHTFGLGHCRQPGCLMNFSANLEKLDQKNLEFCPYCRVLLNDFFSNIEGI